MHSTVRAEMEKKEKSRRRPIYFENGCPKYFDDQLTDYYLGLLETDNRAVIKGVKDGELSALRAIVKYHWQSETRNSKLPDDFYLELFPVCCIHASEEKCRNTNKMMFRDPEAQSKAPRTSANLAPLAFPLAVYSLLAIGSSGMLISAQNRKDDFKPVLLAHWRDLFNAMVFVCEIHINADKEAGFPLRNQWISAILCDVMLVILTCRAVATAISSSPSFFLENIWKWWLYGGPPDYDSIECVVVLMNDSASFCLETIYGILGDKEVPLSVALKSITPFGGIAGVAELALSGFCANAMAGNVFNLKSYFFLFVLFLLYERQEKEECDLGESFMDGIYDAGGMTKLIKGLIHLLTVTRDEFLSPDAEYILVGLLQVLERIMKRSHRHIEDAARSGILELFVALDPERGDVLRTPMLLAKKVLEMIPLHLVYYSVIKSYATEMRKLTEGEHPKDSCFADSDGPFAKSWKKMKQLLIERYCVKRFYDFVIAPAPRLKYCNSCGKSESAIPFQFCANCRRVLYCSKKCQVTDWKEDGHKKDCQEGHHLYGSDIPFLCFLANMYLTTRCFALVERYKEETDPDINLKNAVFRVWFSFMGSLRPVLSVTHVRDAGPQLAKRTGSAPGFEAESPESIDTIVRGGLHPSIPPIFDAKARPGGTKPGPGAQIEVDVYDEMDTVTVRHIAFQPDFRTVMKTKDLDRNSAYALCEDEPRVAAMGFNPAIGKIRPIWVNDVVDVIFEQFYEPGKDAWTFHLRKAGGAEDEREGTKRKHILDFVDDYIKENLTTVEEGTNEIDVERIYNNVLNILREYEAMPKEHQERQIDSEFSAVKDKNENAA